jgi:putative acetyltransferase
MRITLRSLRKSDNKDLAELIRTVFREFKIDRPGTVYFDPTTDDLYTLFQTPGSVYWIAEVDGKMAGGCGVFPTPGLPKGCAEIVKLYLLSDYRGRGTGKQLLEKSIESAKKLGYKQL